MRTSFLAGLAVLVGCGGGESVIEGTLLDSDDASWVWLDGTADRTPITAGEFRIPEVRGDTLDLRFADEDGDAGRMRILGLADGSTLQLRDVWFEDEWAFPTSIELEGSDVVEVNRVRMASVDAARGELTAHGTLLASSSDDDALLVRVSDGGGADLRVVITPATTVVGVDGVLASLGRVEFGDSLTVAGSFSNGYLVASEVTLPRAVTMGVDRLPGDADDREDGRDDERPSDRDRARDDDDDDDDDKPGRRRRFGRSVGGRGRS